MRVIAGTWGGRRLAAPRGAETRPTSDRVREALFMSLEPLSDLRVVDLFAGSGALGIEALSRGASRVDFVEQAAAARRVLKANLDALGIAERAAVWSVRLPGGGRRLEAVLASADLVLVDPPYGGPLACATLEWLGNLLKPGGRAVVEHHAKDGLPVAMGRLERVRQRRYGETMISLYVARDEVQSSRGGPVR